MVLICTTLFNVLNLYILPTEYIRVFHMVLKMYSDCFPKLVVLYSEEMICFL
jgi:hypothetical protein